MAPLFLVDVSYAQGGAAGSNGLRPNRIDWQAAHDGGIAGAIIRASYGTKVDSAWAAQAAAAKKVDGLVLGAYHCLSPASVVSPVAQADAFLAAIAAAGLDARRIILMLDTESVCAGRGSDVRAFTDRIHAKLGAAKLVWQYAPAWYWPRIGNPRTSDLGPLVQSHYVSVADAGDAYPFRTLYSRVPADWWEVRHGGWSTATVLQFTSSGKIDGYSKRVDVNAFRGSLDDLRALAGLPKREPEGVPQEVLAMPIHNLSSAIGTARLTKPWGLRRADGVKLPDLPAGTELPTVARGDYDAGAAKDLPGFLVPYGPDGELHILPAGATVGLLWTPRTLSAAETLAVRQAEHDRVTEGITVSAPAPVVTYPDRPTA